MECHGAERYDRLLTAREYVMIDFMNQITDLVEWDKKVFDQETVARWRAEALDSGEDMSGKMLDWVSFTSWFLQ